MRTRLLLACLAMAVVVAGCASEGREGTEGVGSVSNTFEAGVFNYPEQFRVNEIQLIGECGRRNGLDDFVYTQDDEHEHDREVDRNDEYPGNSGPMKAALDMLRVREEMIANGPPVGEREPSAEEQQVLNDGPVTTPRGTFDGGCYEWAQTEVQASPGYQAWEDTARDYSSWLTDQLAASPEILALNREYGKCMAENGYPGLSSPEDTLSATTQIVERLLNGEIDQDAALAQDFELFRVYEECLQPSQLRRLAIRDELALQYAEANGLDI